MKLNLKIDGRQIRNVEKRFYDTFNNQLYLLLFYHDTTISKFWDYGQTTSFESESRYSILSSLDDTFKINEKFEFLLEYPKFPHIKWRQTNNPLKEVAGPDEKVEGFDPISVDSPLFSGLLNSTNCCLLDGMTHPGNWYYCIGLTCSEYSPNILPGPYEIKLDKVALWTKFPIQTRNTCKQYQQH